MPPPSEDRPGIVEGMLIAAATLAPVLQVALLAWSLLR